MNAKDIERRMDEILGEMRGIGEMLFGSVTTNRNRKTRKRKEGEYVSPPHYTFNSTGENGRKKCKRIRPEDVQRVRDLIGAGRHWKGLEKEYERLANQLAWEAGLKKNSSCRGRSCGESRTSSGSSPTRSSQGRREPSPGSTAS